MHVFHITHYKINVCVKSKICTYIYLYKNNKTKIIKERKNTSKLFEQQRKKEIERERVKKKYLKIFKMKIFIHFFLTESKQKYLSCVKL